MSVATVYAALATIEAAVQIPSTDPAQYTKAYSNPPDTISGNTPCWVNFAADSQVSLLTGGVDDRYQVVDETRNYRCILFVAPRGTGAPGENYGLLTPYFDLGKAAFVAHPAANLTSGTIWLKFQGDEGGKTIPYGNDTSPYYAIPFKVQVQYKTKTLWATGE